MANTPISALTVVRQWKYLVRITEDEHLKITQSEHAGRTFFQLFRTNSRDGSVHNIVPPLDIRAAYYYLRGQIDAVEGRFCLIVT